MRLAIIGAGFTGVALAAALHRYAKEPIEILLIEQTGQFGAGDAYRTPYIWHLLNARAGEMSALEDEPNHFVQWLQTNVIKYLDNDQPVPRQFVPRIFYHQYLCSLVSAIFQDDQSQVTLRLVPKKATDILHTREGIKISLDNQQSLMADRVIMAHGNNPPAALSYSELENIQCIDNPWDYAALENINSHDAVMIIGTGLSMVDAVLTLHHQNHQGKIYAVSRRGLLPLPHSEFTNTSHFDTTSLTKNARRMMKTLRQEANKMIAAGEDWRALFSKIRPDLPIIWQSMDSVNKKRFLRHILPYWNIHRHRVHEKLHALLMSLQDKGQLEIIAGRIQAIGNQQITIKPRLQRNNIDLSVQHIINCMGSSNTLHPEGQPLLHSLMERGEISQDVLGLGLKADHHFQLKTSDGMDLPGCYTLGPPMRGELWECVAVPEIRKQCKALVQQILISNAKKERNNTWNQELLS